MKIVLNQAELKEFANWCVDHLSVDFHDSVCWTVMTFGGQRVMSALVDSVTNDVEGYLVADTDVADACYDLYIMWRNYNA